MQIWNSPAWPNFRHDPALTEAPLARVMARLGTIAGLHAGLAPAEREEIFLRAVTGEALASFAIEGAPLSPAEIEASVVASLACRQAVPQRRTDAIAELMLEARAGQGPLTAAMLQHWHRLLFHGVEAEERGQWRSFAMEIVRRPTGRPEDVLCSAPPPGRMEAEMGRFLAWLAADTRPLPLRAALAHLWFESIHPFADGNGRIGRAIIEHVFATEAALPFSLSRQIEADKRGYYAALQGRAPDCRRGHRRHALRSVAAGPAGSRDRRRRARGALPRPPQRLPLGPCRPAGAPDVRPAPPLRGGRGPGGAGALGRSLRQDGKGLPGDGHARLGGSRAPRRPGPRPGRRAIDALPAGLVSPPPRSCPVPMTAAWCQTAEIHIRVALINRFNALGTAEVVRVA